MVCLALGTNGLTVALAVIGWGVYVGVYSLYMKRHSEYGTLVGSLSGAMPPVVGYCAVTGQFDSGAFMLLVIFCLGSQRLGGQLAAGDFPLGLWYFLTCVQLF